MIVVTGATGRVGSELTRQLVEAGIRPRVLVRSAAAAAAGLGTVPEMIEGDFMRPDTLEPGFEGAGRVFLLSPANPDQVEMEMNVVNAAKSAGVHHIVKLSVMGATPWSTIGFMRQHYVVERYIEDEGLRFTFLRPNLFMQNLLSMANMITTQGRIYAPLGDGEISMVDVRDVAAMALVALTSEEFENRAFEISGPEALSMSEVAERLSESLGRNIHYVDVSEQEARDALHDEGAPDWQISDYLTYQWFLRSDYGSMVTQSIAKMLGRPPRSFAEFARDHAHDLGAQAQRAA